MFYSPTKNKFVNDHAGFRAEFPATSFPKVITTQIMEEFGFFETLAAAEPAASSVLKEVKLNGATVNSEGKWTPAWVEVDKFQNDAEILAYAETLRDAKKALVRDASSLKTVSGVVFNGIEVSTSSTAMGKLTGAMQRPKASRKVVTKGGTVELLEAQFTALFNGVADYIQALIDREYDLLTALSNAGTTEGLTASQVLSEIDAIDTDAGWPSRVL